MSTKDIEKPMPSHHEVESVGVKIEGAKDQVIKERKLSMMSRPNEIKAMIPNLDLSDDELRALGLEKEDDGWHVPNRQYFPNPISKDSVIINYGRKEDGTVDLGFCSQDEFRTIYA